MAKQKSNKPTRKVIAAVITAPIVQYLLPYLDLAGQPELESGILALVVGLVSYFVPPSIIDQVQETLSTNTNNG